MVTQLLVFPLGPRDQVSIQFAHGRVERRTIVAPVILEPTPDDRIEHPRQVFDGLITALWQVPASKRVANGLRCLVRDRRTEIDEELALAILRSSGLKRVPQKIKLLVRVSLLSKIILAIDDLRLFDPHGLWRYRQIGFSSQGTLRATLIHLVETSPAGQTHTELQDLLDLRVHDTLRLLVRARELKRKLWQEVYVYLSRKPRRASRQWAQRQQLAPLPPPGELDPAGIIAALVDILHHPHEEARAVSRRLRTVGHTVTPEQVEAVWTRYDLKQLHAPARGSRGVKVRPRFSRHGLSRASARSPLSSREPSRVRETLHDLPQPHESPNPAYGKNAGPRFLPGPGNHLCLPFRMSEEGPSRHRALCPFISRSCKNVFFGVGQHPLTAPSAEAGGKTGQSA